MSDTAIEARAADLIGVRGTLGFATARRLLADSRPLFAGAAPLTIDLSDVTQADSAGLALLVEWLRLGVERGRAVRFRGIPPQLQSLIDACSLDTLFAQSPGRRPTGE